MTMLVMWLIELFLNQLGELRPQQDAKAAYDSLHDEFQKFLAQKSVKVGYISVYGWVEGRYVNQLGELHPSARR